jgi:hypothetical protein
VRWQIINAAGRPVITFALLAILVYACNNEKSKKNVEENLDSTVTENSTGNGDTVAVKVSDTVLLGLTADILLHIERGEYQQLADYIHPLEGLRFSPYGYIDTTRDQLFTKEKFLSTLSSPSKILWGYYDGSGDPIRLTLREYFRKFVYDVKFARPENLSLNKTVSSGNSLNNLQHIYPGCSFTESYFSGFEKKYEGMDWRSLKLVYKFYEGQYYLVGIIHDQWTI